MAIGASQQLLYLDQKFMLAALLPSAQCNCKVDKVKTAMPVNTVGFEVHVGSWMLY